MVGEFVAAIAAQTEAIGTSTSLPRAENGLDAFKLFVGSRTSVYEARFDDFSVFSCIFT